MGNVCYLPTYFLVDFFFFLSVKARPGLNCFFISWGVKNLVSADVFLILERGAVSPNDLKWVVTLRRQVARLWQHNDMHYGSMSIKTQLFKRWLKKSILTFTVLNSLKCFLVENGNWHAFNDLRGYVICHVLEIWELSNWTQSVTLVITGGVGEEIIIIVSNTM